MIRSRLGRGGRTTIPKAVQEALSLRAGDEIAYVVEVGRATLRRVGCDRSNGEPFGVFSEWEGSADAEAYAGF